MSTSQTGLLFKLPKARTLHTLMSERLVLRSPVRRGRHSTKLVAVVMRTASASTQIRRRNALVCVGSFLDVDLLVWRFSGAAADGDEPEEA